MQMYMYIIIIRTGYIEFCVLQVLWNSFVMPVTSNIMHMHKILKKKRFSCVKMAFLQFVVIQLC